MYGEGNYALTAVKEVSVTESFLGLKEEDKKCQNLESLEDCSTKRYLQSLRSDQTSIKEHSLIFCRRAGCRPFSLGYDENIPVCSAAQLFSIGELEGTTEDCQVPCEGIFADVKKVPIQQHFGQSYWGLLEEYERYRNFNETGIKFINYLGCESILQSRNLEIIPNSLFLR